jgi:tRNA (guanine-N7-)-methyltransferase
MSPEVFPDPQKRAFYGRRKGHKLRCGQASLLATVLPKFALDLARPAPTDLRSLFAVPTDEVQLEIGFGGGEHMVHEAAANPRVGRLGCEAYVNGMAKVLGAIEADGLQNIRLHHGDALEILDWLPRGSLSRIDLLYPDPWPKKRHWKRRFISDEMIRRMARVVHADGTLRFATDWPDYAEWTLQHFLHAPAFTWTAERADDWRKPWGGFPGTRYERKAHAHGARPIYLGFRRV